MYWDHPKPTEAYEVPNQFAFGDRVLVAPITEPTDRELGTASVTAWLPGGEWTDILTGVHYSGGRKIRCTERWTSLPVLAKAGAVIPLDADPAPGNGDPNPEALEVLVIAGADGSFELIEDGDAGTADGDAGAARTPLTWSDNAAVMTVGPVAGDAQVLPAQRDWTISFPGGVHPQRVDATVDGGAAASTWAQKACRYWPCRSARRCGSRTTGRCGGTNDVIGRVYKVLDRAQSSTRSSPGCRTSSRPPIRCPCGCPTCRRSGCPGTWSRRSARSCWPTPGE